jgi:flagellin-like protein
MTSIPPGDQSPIRSSDRTEPAKTRRRQTATVAVLLLIAVVVVLALLL